MDTFTDSGTNHVCAILANQIHPPWLLTYMRITAAPPMAKSIAAFPETKLGNMCEIYKI